MEFEFSAMKVGDALALPPASWNEVRPVYEKCQEYAKSIDPQPQFSFEQIAPTRDGAHPKWLVRRTR